MTRRAFRAWKCRHGIHRVKGAGYCKDCGRFIYSNGKASAHTSFDWLRRFSR